MSNSKAKKLLSSVFEPFGGKARTFIVDYRDKDGNYFNNEDTVIAVGEHERETERIVQDIIKHLEEQGYTAYSIVELLHGYSQAEFQAIAATNPYEASKHCRPIYFDKSKERA